MRVLLHRPPEYESINDKEPLVFLAGPIQGAPDWQTKAVATFQTLPTSLTKLHLANPRRPGLSEADINYKEQVTWEKHHLRRARDYGVIVFWFAARDFTLAYEADRAYAQTSRIEFGRAMGWRDLMPIKLAVGVEDGYKGSEKYYQSCAKEYDMPIYNSLTDTCIAAIEALEDA